MDPSDPGGLPLYVQLLILVLLTLVNAFFAAAEMAFVSVKKTKIMVIAEDKTDGDARAERVLKLLEEPNMFLSTIQVAITFAGFLSAAFASFNMADSFSAFLNSHGIPCNPQVAVVAVTLILSYFTLVFGELVPKRLALIHAEGMAIFSVNIIVAVSKLFSPFVNLLSASVNGIMKILKKDVNSESEDYSVDEIMLMLDAGEEQGEIDASGKEMIHSIFEFGDALAYEIMTPRTAVYMIDINDELTEYLDELLEARHSRIPVYNDGYDDIVGVLNMKDFYLEARRVGFENVDIESILKKPFLVPETKKINDLLTEFQTTKMQMGILIDEYGGFSGVVTVEDILEEIVGGIEDEYEDDEPKVVEIGDGVYIVDGIYDLEDLSDEIGLELESENHETIGGLIMDIMGEVPEETDIHRVLEYENCIFRILAVQDRRVDKVEITVLEPEVPEEETQSDEQRSV